jgi:hypothetical protein
MQYELTLKIAIQSPYGADRVARQMESVFEFGTVKEAIAEGLRLLPDPRLVDVAIQTLPSKKRPPAKPRKEIGFHVKEARVTE